MKRIYLFLLTLSIFHCPLSIFAASWEEANQLYASGEYADAAAQYEAILAESPSPPH